MLSFSATELCSIVGGEFHGEEKDQKIEGISLDTRTLTGKEVFVALKGEKSDGHIFVNPSIGARIVIVDRVVNFPNFILVKDTLKALGDIASFIRVSYNPLVFAITGSNGKTTTKEMLSAILQKEAPVLFTEGNYNNEIGLPLTLFRLTDEHKYAVLEMGMRGFNQIEYLTKIAKPKIGIITFIGEVHVELLGSRDNIAKAKGELLTALPDDGIGIIPKQSDYYSYLKNLHKNSISFGTGGDVYAEKISIDQEGKASFLLCYKTEKEQVSLALKGEHQIDNALAAAAAALAVNISIKTISEALGSMQDISGRLSEMRINDLIVIDDTYNASPSSVLMALKHLEVRRKALGLTAYAALGDMKELGEESLSYHKEVVKEALSLNISKLFLYGPEMEKAFETMEKDFYQKDLVKNKVVIVHSHEEIAHALSSKSGILLLKGSRSMSMEKVISLLR